MKHSENSEGPWPRVFECVESRTVCLARSSRSCGAVNVVIHFDRVVIVKLTMPGGQLEVRVYVVACQSKLGPVLGRGVPGADSGRPLAQHSPIGPGLPSLPACVLASHLVLEQARNPVSKCPTAVMLASVWSAVCSLFEMSDY